MNKTANAPTESIDRPLEMVSIVISICATNQMAGTVCNLPNAWKITNQVSHLQTLAPRVIDIELIISIGFMTYNKLTPKEERVIVHKGTEPPFTGEYDNFYQKGTYICRRCNHPLFSSKSKFDAGCGWPAFDDSFPNALRRLPDPDGERVEIECANCGAHLGHEFVGEYLTPKNTRECVNSLSIRFVPDKP